MPLTWLAGTISLIQADASRLTVLANHRPGLRPVSATPTATPTPVPNPALTITLRAVGITEGHEFIRASFDEIRLLIRVTTGDQSRVLALPPEGADPFAVSVKHPHATAQVIFSTGEVGDRLDVEIIAIEEDPDISSVSNLLASFASTSPAGPLDGAAVAVAAPVVLKGLGLKDESVGWFQGSWSEREDWSPGRYIAVGEGDLQLWFDVKVSGRGMPEKIGRVSPTPTSAPTPKPAPIPTATPIPPPKVIRLAWLNSEGNQVSGILRGTRVQLTAQATGLDGRVVSVGIYETDPRSPDDLVTFVEMAFTGNRGQAIWEAGWMPDGLLGLGGDPEYIFVVLGVGSPQLIVR